MRASALHEIKNELQELSPKRLEELCLLLAKYKKDNKDYLSYLLFEAHDKNSFVNEVKTLVDNHFTELGAQSNLYYAKKSLRKILRIVNKYIKYLSDKSLAAELLIYYLLKLKNSGIPFQKNKLLVNLYHQQIKKINSLIITLHEDLQSDFAADLEKIKI